VVERPEVTEAVPAKVFSLNGRVLPGCRGAYPTVPAEIECPEDSAMDNPNTSGK